MKKILRVLLFSILAITSAPSIADACCTTNCCCTEENEHEKVVEAALKAVEQNNTLKDAQTFFEMTTRQLCENTDVNNEALYFFDYSREDRLAKALVKIFKKHESIFEDFLNFFPNFKARDDNCHYQSMYCCNLIFDNLLNDTDLGEKIAKHAAEKFLSVPTFIIEKIIEARPEYASLFAQKTPENYKKAPYLLVKLIFEKISDEEKTKFLASLKMLSAKKGLFKNFVKQRAPYFLLKKKIGPFKDGVKPKTQSEHHLANHQQNIEENFSIKLVKNKQARRMFKRLHKKEKKEQKNGRYTFVHAQKWKWHFLADIFKQLWKIKYGQKVNNYQFLRFEPKEFNKKEEKKKRKNAMTGNDNYWFQCEDKNNADRLFMNYAAFGNSGNWGSCSASYWLEAHDFSNIYISVQDLFEKMKKANLYEKYEDKLNQLEKLHESSSKYGNMLLLSFTPEQLKKCVIPAGSNGQRFAVTLADGTRTFDTKKILDALKKEKHGVENSNNIFFCTILTHDCALDPINGPRIYSFNAPDKKKFKKYEQLRDEIFKELEQDMMKIRAELIEEYYS